MTGNVTLDLIVHYNSLYALLVYCKGKEQAYNVILKCIQCIMFELKCKLQVLFLKYLTKTKQLYRRNSQLKSEVKSQSIKINLKYHKDFF